jgi:hypothetical protein
VQKMGLVFPSVLLAAVCLPAASGFAQANFQESFDSNGPTQSGTDGPANLISRGWIFRNQSQPLGSRGWFDGYTHYLSPHAGTGYLAVDDASTDFLFGGTVSQWAILPAVPNQIGGDTLTFHAQRIASPLVPSIEVRYSPSGNTSTGSSVTDVGSFTQLLLDVNPVPSTGWQAFSVTVPGSGRLALRYRVQVVGFSGGSYVGIDTLSVGTPPPPPCNLPPAPGGGQTVTWTAAGSPYRLCTDLTIPAGATVLVEPGVQLTIDSGRTLSIVGSLIGRASASSPIAISGMVSLVTPPVRVFGVLDLQFADVSGYVLADSGGSIACTSCRFLGGSLVTRAALLGDGPKFVDVRECRFEAGGVSMIDGTLALRESTFAGSTASLLRGYVLLENLAFDAGSLSLFKDHQPVLVDGVTVDNAPSAGLVLAGAQAGNDFQLGSNVVLRNNLYPVRLESAGLLPGSAIPPAGNVNNFIQGPGAGDFRGPFTWSDTGVPYVIDGYATVFGGPLRILPGTTVKFLGSQIPGLEDHGERLLARGRPGRPVRFEPFDPSVRWYGLVKPGRLEHCIVDGSEFGLIYAQFAPPNAVESCILRNNARAVVGPVVVRGSDFVNNGVAVGRQSAFDTGGDFAGTTNPNGFAGNAVGLEVGSDARHNWWGHPSGPTSPQNPGGTGDSAAGGIPVVPFRTSPPDRTDSPPIVHLHQPPFLLEPGSRILLSWDVEEDRGIASQRVLFSPAGNAPWNFGLVAEGLPASQRAFEFTVPNIGFQVTGELAALRIVCTDTASQEGWDEWSGVIPSGEVAGTATITTDLTGPFAAGQSVPLCFTVQGTDFGFGGVDAFLFLDGDDRSIGLGGLTGSGCLPLPVRMPYASTDAARIGIRMRGSCCNRVKWFFSDTFTIRPDPRIGDSAPAVQLLTPRAGESFPAGSTIPIAWSASDDEAIRSFDVQASFDAGRTWGFVADGLPGSATGTAWPTAPGAGFPDVRVRVIARDRRFQNSSDGASVSFAMLPTTDVVVALAPRSTTVRPGGTLFYDASLSNPTGASRMVDVWVDAFLPDGRPYRGNPIALARSVTLAPGRSIHRVARLNVPASVRPSGPYVIRGSAGTFPDAPVGQSSFSFSVVP